LCYIVTSERDATSAHNGSVASLPYCPVGLSAALGSGKNLVEYVQFKEVGRAGYRSEPTCLFSVGHWMISSGSKSDAATLLRSGRQINSQIALHHYVLVNFEVSVPDEGNPPRSTEDAGELVCEIQVHTQAQNLWATVSHELLYKPVQEAPSEVARGVYRLMAILELLDGKVERGRDQIRRLPGYEEARMLTILEQQFWTLVARPTDVDLSKRIITVLLPLIGSDNASDYKSTPDTFVETHREKLDEIFADYAEDDRNVLLSQPECLLAFERLTVDPFALVDVWQRHLPTDLLTSLSEVWGTPVTL